MTSPVDPEIQLAARQVKLPSEGVRATVELLDEGNTVPFITRYRKERTGGLDEQQIRAIESSIRFIRALAERKQTILKSIEARGSLTPELAQQIEKARSQRELEDIYLPYKPKKQTLATLARERGLEPLAREIFDAAPAAADLDKRAEDFIDPDKQLPATATVLLGVGHLLAERFSENAALRGKLRSTLWRSGKLICSQAAPTAEEKASEAAKEEQAKVAASAQAAAETAAAPAQPPAETPAETTSEAAPTAEAASAENTPEQPAAATPAAESPAETAVEAPPAETAEAAAAEAPTSESAPAETPTAEAAAESPATETPAAEASAPASETPPAPTAAKKKRKKKKKKKEKDKADAFRDFFNYAEPLSKVPPHRVLAINRGEREKFLRVRIETENDEALYEMAREILVPAEHPHKDFLEGCARDALTRLLLPALEREIRRELTEQAEDHAIEVFAQNLRNLLLQPPVQGQRVLAIDPGFRSGCKLAALDEMGGVLAIDVITIVGREERRQSGREKIVNLVKEHNISAIVVGNGTACRQTEELVADLLAKELKDCEVGYVIVNEAGASVYSTSQLGRDELPEFDATQRSAVSIGRRLLDPLSELVKINPAHIGVGLYQHDVKGKHLQDSLDAVVESCVNFVGVNVNTASPALLRYVSGMNQLTARRVVEYRGEHGAFKSRAELMNVSGLGEGTFVQAAGFLRVENGEYPLDATWIHPESYEVAQRLLDELGVDLPAPAEPAAAPPTAPTAPTALAEETPAEAPAAETASEAAQAPPAAEAETVEPAEKAEPTETPEPAAAETAATEAPASETSAPSEPAAASEPVAASETAPPPPTSALKQAAKAAAGIATEQVEQLATKFEVSPILVRDLLSALARPGRDPRDDLPAPVFRRGIVRLEDLEPNMELTGTVLNVVDFGAFVDIGLSDSALVHISRLADRYIRDPHEVVSVGTVLKVWVLDVDKQRRRVGLTAIQPGTERPRPERRQRSDKAEEKPRPRRRPRSGDKPAGKGEKRPNRRPQTQPPRRSKPAAPIVPISKDMKEGKAPMRTFGDLKQFFQKQDDDKPEKKKE